MHKGNGKTFNKSSIMLYACLLSYMHTTYLDLFPSIKLSYDIFRICIVGYIAYKFFVKKRKFSSFDILWIAFEMAIVTITVLNRGDSFASVKNAITIVSIAMLFHIYKNNYYKIFRALYELLVVFVLINLATIILFPNGLYSSNTYAARQLNWFLGYKNGHIVFELPLMAITLILMRIECNSRKKIIVLAAVIISSLLAGSTTTIISIFVMIVASLLPFIWKSSKFFNMYSYTILSIISLIAFPFLRIQYFFEKPILLLFGKTADFSFRTSLWDRAIFAISQKPILGWGEQSANTKHIFYSAANVVSAHNQLLEILYVGGVILLFLYFVICFKIAKKTFRERESKIVQIASGLFCALIVAYIAEAYTDSLIFMIYFLVWYSPELSLQIKNRGKA